MKIRQNLYAGALTGLAAAGLVLASGCTPGQVAMTHQDAGPRQRVCIGAVVTIDDGDPVTCDMSPPQRLDVRLPGYDGYDDAAAHERCDNMGATFALVNGTVVCQGADY